MFRFQVVDRWLCLVVICVKVLEPQNPERVREDPMYSRILAICSWYDDLRASR